MTDTIVLLATCPNCQNEFLKELPKSIRSKLKEIEQLRTENAELRGLLSQAIHGAEISNAELQTLRKQNEKMYNALDRIAWIKTTDYAVGAVAIAKDALDGAK